MLIILWKRGEIAPEEQFLLLPTIFCYLMLDFYVKTGIRFSHRDKRLSEITEVEITRVDCRFNLCCWITWKSHWNNSICIAIKVVHVLCLPTCSKSIISVTEGVSLNIFYSTISYIYTHAIYVINRIRTESIAYIWNASRDTFPFMPWSGNDPSKGRQRFSKLFLLTNWEELLQCCVSIKHFLKFC